MGLGGAFLAFAGLWAVPYLTDHLGLSREGATWHTTAMLLAFALSSLATGRLSDRLALRKAPMLVLGAVQVACWGVLAAGLPLAGWASMGLFALMGATATAFTLTWASVKEVNPPALAGTAMAVVNTGVFLGPTVYQPLVGWVVDRAGFERGVAVLAACAAGGLAAALFVRETHGRNVTRE
jgi:MFS family permease